MQNFSYSPRIAYILNYHHLNDRGVIKFATAYVALKLRQPTLQEFRSLFAKDMRYCANKASNEREN